VHRVFCYRADGTRVGKVALKRTWSAGFSACHSLDRRIDQIALAERKKDAGFCVADAVAERAEHAGLRICERQRADAGHAVACENAETVYPCLVRAGRDLHGMRFITPLDAELDRAALRRLERGLKLGIR